MSAQGQRTGWQPHYTRRGGRWRDLDVYALTREWWEAARARY